MNAEKEFRKKYDEKLNEFGFKYDGTSEGEKYTAINYLDKEGAWLIIGIDKETKETRAELLYFDGPENKAEYDFTIDELFEFLEKEVD